MQPKQQIPLLLTKRRRRRHQSRYYSYFYRYWIRLRYSYGGIGTFIPNLWQFYHIPPSSDRIDDNNNHHQLRRRQPFHYCTKDRCQRHPWSLSDRIPIINNSYIKNYNNGFGHLRYYYCICMVKYTNCTLFGPVILVPPQRQAIRHSVSMILWQKLATIKSYSPFYCIKLQDQRRMDIGLVKSRTMCHFNNCILVMLPHNTIISGINNKLYDFKKNYNTITQIKRSKTNEWVNDWTTFCRPFR